MKRYSYPSVISGLILASSVVGGCGIDYSKNRGDQAGVGGSDADADGVDGNLGGSRNDSDESSGGGSKGSDDSGDGSGADSGDADGGSGGGPDESSGGATDDGTGGGAGGVDGAGGENDEGSGGAGTGGAEPCDKSECSCNPDACPLEVGEICTRDADCLNDVCRAAADESSVCCSVDCTTAEDCAPDGLSCVPGAVCEVDELRCNGSELLGCSAGQWEQANECGALGCLPAILDCAAAAGEACAIEADCGEGSCVESEGGSSICCTASCGNCQICGVDGASCIDLQDDDTCGSVACPADTTCRDYQSSYSGNRCASGQCGMPEQLCGFAAQNVGTECSAEYLCDSQGDCAQLKKGQGASCAAGNECVSGSCVDNVCCNEACDATCETCADTGVCRMPAHDTACSPVICDHLTNTDINEDCVELHTNIESNLCDTRGACKGTEACGYRPVSTYCDDVGSGTAYCDGFGACDDPSIACDGGECPTVYGNSCCVEDTGTSEFCGTCASEDVEVACDEPGDCPSGQTCCYSGGTEARVACRAKSDCEVEEGLSSNRAPLCASPDFDSGETCEVGECTFVAPILSEYKFCELTGL